MSGAARLPWVDSARGLALWAMFFFHFTWDLAHFGWIDRALVLSRDFHWLGHAIASSFLLLVGISLVLARRARGPLLRSRAFWRRWAMLVIAAGAISAISFWQFPRTPIFFGILHCIALASLIAAPLVEAPAWVALASGVVSLLAPTL
ncbi:MAG TPA: heparan-alpha-glucosaminide N-acetyltransferase domain-containing protein, partial [Rhodoblastus sp.]|nr:heparan-alpha-glucosaminide N-acetyltransferase domain-containing protein [Rhodoblastus sp.]